MNTYGYFTKIDILPAIKCTAVSCSSPEHIMQIDQFWDDVCSALKQSGIDSIPSVEGKDGRDYISPGFHEFLKELHTAARTVFLHGEMLLSLNLDSSISNSQY